MANSYDDDEFDGDPAGLRKIIKDQKKRLGELETEITGLRAKGRERTVRDVLAAKGVANATKIAKLIPADVADEDAVGSWLDEFGDVFGISVASEGDEATGGQGQPVQPQGYTAEQQQALAAINGASVGLPIEANTDLESRIRNAQSQEELEQILRNPLAG